MSVLIFQFIPPSLTLSVIIILFSMSMTLFQFRNMFICTSLQDSTYKWYHMTFVFVWLTSLTMTISEFIHVIADGIVSLLYGWVILIMCICICMHAHTHTHTHTHAHTPPSLYPFLRQWAFVLLPCFSCCK